MIKPDDHFVELPEFNVSYKPQKISPKFPSTVRNLLHKRIRDAYLHPQFVTDVMKPMQARIQAVVFPVSSYVVTLHIFYLQTPHARWSPWVMSSMHSAHMLSQIPCVQYSHQLLLCLSASCKHGS